MKINIKFKSIAIATVISGSMISSTIYAAGIPTIDGVQKVEAVIQTGQNFANLALTGAQIANQLAQTANQAAQSIEQIAEIRLTIKALTGNSELGQVLNDPTTRRTLNQYLPVGYDDVYQLINNGTGSGPDFAALQTVYERVTAEEVANRANTNVTGRTRLAATMLLNKAQMDVMMSSLNQRSANMQGLINQINSTTDASSKADLANRLQAEQGMISIDMNKMQIAMATQKQNEALANRQVQRESVKRFNR